MSNQLAKLDFWNYFAYAGSTANFADQADYIDKQSAGLIQPKGATPTITFYSNAASNKISSGETLYQIGGTGNYLSSFLLGVGSGGNYGQPQLTASGLSSVNAVSGLEFHQARFNASGASTNGAYTWTIGVNTYNVQWATTGLILTRNASGATWDAGSDSVGVASATEWQTHKLRIFSSGGDLYIKFSGVEGAKTVIAQKVYAGEGGSITAWNSDGQGGSKHDNISLYGVSSAQATTYAATIDADITGGTITNDMLPFQRYTPLLDLIPIFGADWTGSDGTAAQDLTDGDLTTYATTDTKDTPIGFIASDGLTNVITSAEWFMVAAGGVGVDFSSVGGPASGVLHDVFLATSGATIGTNSVYPLLTMGDLQRRTYAWTPGTLTQLPGIGIIRSGGSMTFSVANTEAEDLRFYFGVPVDGANVSGFNYVLKDVSTTGNEFGETLATNNFDNGLGEFGAILVESDTPVIGFRYKVLANGDYTTWGGSGTAVIGDIFTSTSASALTAGLSLTLAPFLTSQPVIFTLERKS